MNKISRNTRLFLTLVGVNLDFLGLFFFIISLLNFFGESSTFQIVGISFVLIGALLIFIGFKGFNRNSPKSSR